MLWTTISKTTFSTKDNSPYSCLPPCLLSSSTRLRGLMLWLTISRHPYTIQAVCGGGPYSSVACATRSFQLELTQEEADALDAALTKIEENPESAISTFSLDSFGISSASLGVSSAKGRTKSIRQYKEQAQTLRPNLRSLERQRLNSLPRPLLLLLLLALSTHMSTLAGGAEISGDISTWNPLFQEQHPEKKRFWTWEDLDPAYLNLGKLSTAKRLIDKLNNGQPITVAGIGSSALLDLGITLNPSVYPQPGETAKIEAINNRTHPCWSNTGYWTSTMDMLNRTWPNSKHVWVNLGRNGAGLETFTGGICWESGLPQEVDLIMIDHNSIFSRPYAVERLMRMLLHAKYEPAIMMFANMMLCQGCAGIPINAHSLLQEFQHCFLGNVNSSCELVAKMQPEGITSKESIFLAERTSFHEEYAVMYNTSHIDMHTTMKNLIQHNVSMNTSRMDIMKAIYHDTGHPRNPKLPGGLGHLLLADLMVGWIYKQQQRVAMADPSLDTTVRDPSTPATLPKARFPEAARVFEPRCWGVSYEQVMSHSLSVGLHEEHKKGMAEAQQIAGMQSFFETNGFSSTPSLKVLSGNGFTVQGFYKGKLGPRFKPGYLTDKAGAELIFEVDTSFPEHPTSRVEISFLFTLSYDGWGMAEIKCLSKCTCETIWVDANGHLREKHSVLKSVATAITQHKECEMSLRVLDKTNSDGHKFMLSQVMARCFRRSPDQGASGGPLIRVLQEDPRSLLIRVLQEVP
eukprot:gene31108-6239_t